MCDAEMLTIIAITSFVSLVMLIIYLSSTFKKCDYCGKVITDNDWNNDNVIIESVICETSDIIDNDNINQIYKHKDCNK